MALLKKFKPHHHKVRGITLLEISLGMMILCVLSIGVSSLVKTGVESQMSERTHQYMQTIALNIVDDIRLDIRKADDVTVGSNGQTLNILIDTTNVTYQLESGGKFSRNETGKPKKYYNYDAAKSTYWNGIQLSCNDPVNNTTQCFVEQSMNQDATKNRARQIQIPYLKAVKPMNASQRMSIIDQFFDEPNFAIRDFSFNVPSATVFQ
jgi:type II secretory pathway pseudopilin PulG